jgi:glycosyltransferase involved in cell wall biosynthesis
LARAARQTAENSFSRERLAREIDDVYEGIAPSERLRVLHVHSGNLYGGVETFLRTLARDGGAARQMVSTFALCFDGALSKELRALGSSPHMLGVVRLRHPFTVRRARRSLARLLARQRFDVIACHQAWAYAIFAPTIRRAGLPLVFWQHTADDGRHWLARLARRVSPDLAVACSQYATERLSRWFPNARKLTIFCPLHTDASPTCDTVSRAALRRSLDTAPDDLVVVQVGRLDPDKGNRETLEALASLRDLGCWTYWMVGGPQSVAEERYLRDLMTLGRRHGISDRVRFVGQRQDVAALLDAADVYCQPNVRPEPFGLSLVEAQAAGLPIVTSAIGGAFEIVTEACGMLVPPDDIGALSDALRRLLTDAKLRARLGAAGRDAGPALCDVRRQMQRISDVLLDVADRHRRSSLAAGATPLQASPRS